MPWFLLAPFPEVIELANGAVDGRSFNAGETRGLLERLQCGGGKAQYLGLVFQLRSCIKRCGSEVNNLTDADGQTDHGKSRLQFTDRRRQALHRETGTAGFDTMRFQFGAEFLNPCFRLK